MNIPPRRSHVLTLTLVAALCAHLAACGDGENPSRIAAGAATATQPPTNTPSITRTATQVPSNTRASTSTPTPSPTETATETATSTPSRTATATPGPVRGMGVAIPSIEGPISGGAGQPFLATTTFDLAEVGYSAAEYFMSGTATSYTNTAPLTLDGKWSVAPASTAAYKTRILIYRPIDGNRFNGTVIVEWLNVSGGLDAGPDWIAAHVQLIREGFAWVGVSAQFAGVESGTSLVGLQPMPLKMVDPERYGSLVHPGDSFSYDIFSQAGQAIRRPSAPTSLSDLRIEKVIAVGESQSAFRLVTYIDGVHPLADMYDGYLVHSRGSLGTPPLSESPQAVINVPGSVPIRDDLDVPVLTFETETDLGLLQFVPARQPDTDRFRLWEVAGTAHADVYTTAGSADRGDDPSVANLVVTTMPVAGINCLDPINSGPQHFVLDAAFSALNQWVVRGTPPPVAARIVTDSSNAIVRDSNGIALGGIRTPQVDVPIATLSGEGQVGSLFCLIFGTTVPFDDVKLASLYPDHETYVTLYDQAADRVTAAGFLVPADAALLKAAAASSDIGG